MRHLLLAAHYLPHTHFLRITTPLPIPLLTAATLAILPEPMAYAHLAGVELQTLARIADGTESQDPTPQRVPSTSRPVSDASAASFDGPIQHAAVPGDPSCVPSSQALHAESASMRSPPLQPCDDAEAAQAADRDAQPAPSQVPSHGHPDMPVGDGADGATPTAEPGTNNGTAVHAAMPPVFIEMRPAQQFAASEQAAGGALPDPAPQPAPSTTHPWHSSDTEAGPAMSQRMATYTPSPASAQQNRKDNCPVMLETLPVGTRLRAAASIASRLRAEVSRMDGGDAAADWALLGHSQQPLSSAARMALEYRARQKGIAQAALTALDSHVGSLLQTASQSWAAVSTASCLPDDPPHCWHHPKLPNQPRAHQSHDAPQGNHGLSQQCGPLLVGNVTLTSPSSRQAASNANGTTAVLQESARQLEAAELSPMNEERDAERACHLPAGLAATLGGGVEVMTAAWGMRVAEDLQKGDLLVRVNHSEMMSADSADELTDRLVAAALQAIAGQPAPLLF